MQISIYREFILYLWGGDVEHFCDLGIQLLHIGESMDSACGTTMSQLGVEDEPWSRVFWWPRWWWWWWRWKRGCCRLDTFLILAVVLGLLLLHGFGPCCLGVLWAHSLPVLHWPQLRCVPPLGALVLHYSGRERNTVLPLAQSSKQPTQSFVVKDADELVMSVAW